ncbi:MAG: RseA family anti-sigma factor [Nitrosomonadales bacterium]|jgi:hypothetical protein
MSEKISEFFDHQTNANKIDSLVGDLTKNKKEKEAFKYYQLISDVLHHDHGFISDHAVDKIMQKIDQEPIQFNNGFIRPAMQNTLTFDFKKYALYVFASLMLVGTTWFIATNTNDSASSSVPVFLAEEISEQLLNDHNSTTTTNPNFFIQANYQADI